MRKFCNNCCISMRPKRNGFDIIACDDEGNAYQIFSSDLWRCPKCGNETAFPAVGPWRSREDPDFAAVVGRIVAKGTAGETYAFEQPFRTDEEQAAFAQYLAETNQL